MYTRTVLVSLMTAGLAGAAEYHFGLIGITPIETIRMAAYCLADPLADPARPCDVEFHVHDRGGRILKRAAMTLPAGTGGYLDFRLADAGLNVRRGEAIPCWLVASGPVALNLQVFDNFTFRTRIFRNLGDRPAAMAGEIHVGMVGLTGFDTARINAFCPIDPLRDPSEPCDVTFIFHDAMGRVLKQSMATLQPGTGGFLDFRTAEAGLPARRGEIQPCFRVGRGAIVATLEVFDTLTGLDTVFAHAAAALMP